MSKLRIFEHFLSVGKSEAKTQVIFQAETPTNIFTIELPPCIQQNWSKNFSPLWPPLRPLHLMGSPRSSLARVRSAAMKRKMAADLRVLTLTAVIELYAAGSIRDISLFWVPLTVIGSGT